MIISVIQYFTFYVKNFILIRWSYKLNFVFICMSHHTRLYGAW